jgi:HAD superfamily hydrolase (TIGR01509 family)
MLQKFAAILWDVDGTLIDSEPVHLAGMRQVHEAHGESLSEMEVEDMLGLTDAECWRWVQAHRPIPMEEALWHLELQARYNANLHLARPRAEAVELARRFSAWGVPQAAVSNAARVNVDANLRALGLTRILSISVAAEDVSDGKPHPAPYLAGARLLGVDPAACLAVEDSPVGCRSAKAAGMTVFCTPQRLDLDYSAADLILERIDSLDWSAMYGR